jgi:hypothetical protein
MLKEAPQNTHNLAPKSIELHVFEPKDREYIGYSSHLIEDDGLTFEALKGKR